MKRTLFPVAILTVLYLAALALWPEALNHNSEYQWPVLHHGVAIKLIPVTIALAIIIAILVANLRKKNGERFSFQSNLRVVPFLFFLGLALQIIPITVHQMGLLEFPLRVYLPDHTSYFTDAVRYSTPLQVFEFEKQFPKKVTDLLLGTHSRTHPPGAILFFKSFIDVSKSMPGFVEWYQKAIPKSQEAKEHFRLIADEVAAGGLSALFILLVAAVVPCLAWKIGILLEEKTESAWLGSVLFLITPTFSNKSPILDQVSAFIILLGFGIFLHGMKTKKLWLGLVSGLLLSSGLWLGYTALASFPLIILLALAWFWKKSAGSLLSYFTLFVVGIGLFCLWDFLFFPGDSIAIYRANLAGWYFNNTVSGRIHMWKWILFNPYEFFAWLGVPIFLLFALAVWREIKKAWRKQWDRIDPLIWAIVLFGLALDLSGRVCYESPRLAWFYAPLVCLVAAKGFTETQGSNRAWPLAIVLVLQAATVLVFRMLF